MPKLPSFDPIDYLVRRKHPKAVSLIAARLNIGDADVPSYQEVLRHQKAADAFRKKLSSKTPAEIAELVRAEKEKKEAEIEQRRFYNRPAAQADFDHYCKMPFWKLDECVALSLGKEPKYINWTNIRPYTEALPFAREYEKRRELFNRAGLCGQLSDPVAPVEFIAWAKENKVSLPGALINRPVNGSVSLKSWRDLYHEERAQLAALTKKHNQEVEDLTETLRNARSEIDALRQHRPTNQANLQASDSNKPLGTKERDSLLKLVGGMAVRGYVFDPRQSRNSATKDIRDDLEALGLSMDDGTVLKYLNQGAELIPRDVLENVKPKPNSAKR
jgi:hypothetical protein